MGIGIIIFTFVILRFGEKALIFWTIVSFLSITSTIDIQLRYAIQVLNFIILSFLFFKQFGLNIKKYPKSPTEINIFVLLLFITMTLSTVLSNFILLGLQQIVRTAIFFIIIYYYYSFLDSYRRVKLYLYSLLFTALIFSCVLFYELYQMDFNLIQFNIDQMKVVNGDYINKNSLASFFILAISLILSFGVVGLKQKRKYIITLMLFVFITSLLVTNSRAAILSVIISALIILFQLNKKLFKKILILIIAPIPLLLFEPVNKLFQLYFRLETVFTGRDYIWDSIFQVIKKNYLFGAGPAGSKEEIYKTIPFMLGSPEELWINYHYNQIEFGHAHNFYLFFLSDLGILGFIIALAFPFVFLRIAFKVLKNIGKNNQEVYILVVGITAGGIGLFIRGLFEWSSLISYGTIAADLPFWLLFAILTFIYQKTKARMIY